jgi:hypothetical protein
MAGTDQERSAADNAAGVLGMLKPATFRNIGTTVETLRNAHVIATKAISNLPSEESLNDARAEVGFALPELIKALNENDLIDERIERAKRAVENWKSRLVTSQPPDTSV